MSHDGHDCIEEYLQRQAERSPVYMLLFKQGCIWQVHLQILEGIMRNIYKHTLRIIPGMVPLVRAVLGCTQK